MSFFESAEQAPHHLPTKEDYSQLHDNLRVQLLELQQQLKKANFSVMVLIAGVDGGGKGSTIRQLNEWMDPRFLRTYAFSPEDLPADRPSLWAFWQNMPRRGRMAIYAGSWYSKPLTDRVHHHSDDHQLDTRLDAINRFEKLLSDEGTLIIKLWLHLDKEDQQERIKVLSSNPDTAWRVSERDLRHLQVYPWFREVAGRVLTVTDTLQAPWHVVYGKDSEFRAVSIARILAERIGQRLQQQERESVQRQPLETSGPAGTTAETITAGGKAENTAIAGAEIHCQRHTLLDDLDLSLKLKKSDYFARLEAAQARLNWLSRQAVHAQLPVLILFEGWDAAGKGGLIRRLVAPMDARHYRIIPVAAPTQEELNYHYLWRFWQQVPAPGQVSIFDRSWYGRVLVERVESLASLAQWQRAYQEINDFEQQLCDAGVLLCKYWLHISPQEQWQRFQRRETIPYKRFKIGEEDYRNRSRWCEYAEAVDDMVRQTSTDHAPWRLIEANNKRFARVKVIEDVCERLERTLGPSWVNQQV